MGGVIKSVARIAVSPLSIIDKDLGRTVLQVVAMVAPFIPGGQIIAAAAAISLATLYKPTAPKPSAAGSGSPSTFRQVIGQSSIVYGETRIGGPIHFYHAKQSPEELRYFVITLAGHSIHAVTGYMLNDELVTVDGAGMVTTGKYANNAWIWPELGDTDAVANATFVAECEGKWTADHRGRGVAKLYAKFRLTDEVIAEGMPNITVIVQGKNDIYDPRTETAGYSNNAILCAYDWLRMPRADGGFGIGDDEVDWDFVATQANVCDEDVPLKAGGTEKRYTLDGVIQTGAAPDEIRDAMLSACGGEHVYTAGIFKIYAAYWRPPAGDPLSESDLVTDIKVSPLSAGDLIANEVKGTFIDPRQKYQPAEYPAYVISTDDDLRSVDLDLPFTKSYTMAQRLAKIAAMRTSAERSVTWPMNIKGLSYEALDVVQVATARHGLSNYSWKVGAWSLNDDFSVVLPLREESPEFYDWDPATDEKDLPVASEALSTPIAIGIGAGSAPSGLTVTAQTSTTVTLTFVMPDNTRSTGFQVLMSPTSSLLGSSPVASGSAFASASVEVTITDLTPNTDYWFWVRGVNIGTMTPPSASASAHTTI